MLRHLFKTAIDNRVGIVELCLTSEVNDTVHSI